MARKLILGRQAQNRATAVRYVLMIGVLLLLLSVVQTTVCARWRLFGAIPDFILCAVLGVAFFSGQYAGAMTGIAGGFLIEALGSTGISLLPVFYMVCGYVIGHYARTNIPRRFTAYLFYLLFALPSRAAVTVTYASLTYRELRLPTLLTHAVLPELAGTAIAALLFYLPMRKFCAMLGGKSSTGKVDYSMRG